MALTLFSKRADPFFFQNLFLFSSIRHKYMGNVRQKRKINPFVKRHTDFIKELCIALVKYERIQTTFERAKVLEKYGNLLIELTQRTQPPPDLFALENGFLLRPDEITAKFTEKQLINRRWKKRIVFPTSTSTEQFVATCRNEAENILLKDKEAIEKLYGELSDRYRGKYGGYVKVTKIPNQPNKKFPWLAYVEYQDNNLPALPPMPEVIKGELKGRPRMYNLHELNASSNIISEQ
ncbi:large ribosomal subunit protein bL17 [Hydra vulgaris]|uniref:Large ribosomal subunit protein bL17m n=1 Tax=Hydra vulgaris TaxID=6087 RepID=A0ABM4B5N9_HYDVU